MTPQTSGIRPLLPAAGALTAGGEGVPLMAARATPILTALRLPIASRAPDVHRGTSRLRCDDGRRELMRSRAGSARRLRVARAILQSTNLVSRLLSRAVARHCRAGQNGLHHFAANAEAYKYVPSTSRALAEMSAVSARQSAPMPTDCVRVGSSASSASRKEGTSASATSGVS